MGGNEPDEEMKYCAELKCKANLKEEGALSVYCDICESLYCNKCMNVPTKKLFDMITNCKNIKMACDKCLKFSFTNLCKNKIKEETLTEQLKSLQKDIDGIKGMERNIEKELNETLSYSKVLKQNIEEIKVENLNGDAKVNDQELEKVGDIIRDKINEDMQIKVKNEAIERSLIIQGIAEDSIKNYDKRITNEMQKLEHLITDGMKLSMPKIEKLQRIGKFNEENGQRNRAIRVIFTDKFDRDKILRNKSNLRQADDKYKNCYINKDLTLNEKKEYEIKLNEAKELNKKDENKDKFFVVRGRPSKWEIIEKVRRADH